MKNKYLCLCAMTGILGLTGCNFINLGNKIDSTPTSTNTGENVTGTTTDVEIEEDNVTMKFSIVDATNNEVTDTNGVYNIIAGGVYTVSGKLTNGQIYVDTTEEVELVLSNVSIANSSVSPIFVNNCADISIKAKKDTTNYIYDTRTTDFSTTTDETIGTAAIYVSNGDLKLCGKGTLSVTSTANSGIHGKDNVKVKNLTMIVKAQNNGIKGNDKVTIEENPTLGIVAGNNGIITSNSEIGNNGSQHGYIYINGGSITINSYGDGIDAAYSVVIGTSTDADGVTYIPALDIYTNIYSSYSQSTTTNNLISYNRGGPGGGWGNNGFDNGGMSGGTSAEKADVSAKAIKANESIEVTAGTIFSYTYDDGLHTNNDEQLESNVTPNAAINISGGTLKMKASDDAIHADGTLTISGGEIYIAEAHEGVEGKKINITGGKITVFANDDAINASNSINISGGYIDVNMPSNGDVDGIDSNGSITISGGTTIVRGPNSEMACPLDADGSISITGGTVIACGYCSTRTILKGSNMTLTTSTSGLTTGDHTVTIGSETISYSNIYTYSGNTYVYGSGTATVK